MENIALKEIATRVSIEELLGGVAGRYSFPGLLVVTATVLACHLVPACRQTQPTVDCSTRYSLEVANDAAGRVRIRFGIGGQAFMDIPASEQRSGSWSGIVALDRGDRRAFEKSAFGPRDSPEDNFLVRSFGDIHSYEADSDTLYRNYEHPFGRCGDDLVCWDSGDDTLFYHIHSNGTTEHLFVELPERPFYLERDKEDPDLARIVITFIPSVADAGSRNAVE